MLRKGDLAHYYGLQHEGRVGWVVRIDSDTLGFHKITFVDDNLKHSCHKCFLRKIEEPEEPNWEI